MTTTPIKAKVLPLMVATCFLATGCTPTAAVRLPDGGEGFTISCSGTLRSWAGCFETAGEKCGSRGYDIINRSADTTIDTASRSMLIKCK